MSARVDLKRAPIETLGRLVEWFQRPGREHFTYWRTLFAGKRWALVLITSGKPGEPQSPAHEPYRRTSDREVHVIRRHREASGGANPEESP